MVTEAQLNQPVPRAGKFRKLPVVISAWLIDFDNPKPAWVAEAFEAEEIDWCPTGEGLYVNTLEGQMKGDMGDWLISGVKGELYACKPDIFTATYEPAQDQAPEGGLPDDSQAQQADAWQAVCKVLHEVAPGWLDRQAPAVELAVSAIRRLAAGQTSAKVDDLSDDQIADMIDGDGRGFACEFISSAPVVGMDAAIKAIRAAIASKVQPK